MSDNRIELLTALAGAPQAFAELLSVASAETAARRPEPRRWSAAEVVAHLAEHELVLGVRLRMILTAEEPALLPYDQDAWALVGDYIARPAAESLALFGAVRAANVALLRRLERAGWQRAGLHPERGRLTVSDIANFTARHDRRHLEQARRALAAE
jgi:hypothetical protein